MTVSSTNRAAGPFLGNGVTTVFPFNFKTDNASELTVTRRDAAGTEIVESPGVNYTVSLNADQQNSPGGTVTRTPALPTGETLTISSQLAFTQGVDLVNLGGFFPDIIEGALDRVTLLAQQVNDNLTRTIRVPITDGLAGTLTLPTAVARANKVLAFDATGTPVAGGTSPVYLPTIPSQAGNVGRFLSTDGTNTVWNPVTVGSIPGTFALTGDISPAQLTANTDNWAPTGLSGASVIRVSTDASRNLTGLTGGAGGRLLTVQNIGSFDLVLTHEDAASTAANRIICPSSTNFTIPANSAVLLQYDAISSRWRVLGNTSSSPTIPNAGYADNRYYYGYNYVGGSLVLLTPDTLRVSHFFVGAEQTFNRIGLEVATAGAGSSVRLGICTLSGGRPVSLILDAGTVSTATTGIKEIAISITLPHGLYGLITNTNGAPTIPAYEPLGMGDNHIYGSDTPSGTYYATWRATSAYAAFPTTLPTTWTLGGFYASPALWLRKV